MLAITQSAMHARIGANEMEWNKTRPCRRDGRHVISSFNLELTIDVALLVIEVTKLMSG